MVLVLFVAAGLYLRSTQATARERLHEDIVRQADLAARLTAGAMQANNPANRSYAISKLSGSAAEVQAAVDANVRADPQARVLVLGEGRRVLGAHPRTLKGDAGLLLRSPEIASALRGHVTLSDVFSSKLGPQVMLAVPFSTKGGSRRVWTSSTPVATVAAIADVYLSTVIAAKGSRAYLVDSRERVLAASGIGRRRGTVDLDPALVAALDGAPSGIAGDYDYAASPVASTAWRVVLASPTSTLLAPVRTSQRVAWVMFAAFVLVTLLLLWMGYTAISRSARLAHERLHDALTGLPNRTLLLDRAEQAILQLRREEHIAALFIDLDHFKAVNDVHGHDVGDRLLAAVADRLRESVRDGDTVSRFGGDEFLVLCSELGGEEEASALADRIRTALERPFHIKGHVLSVGCSIGIAHHSAVGGKIDAATLIHNADLAMYRAKQAGRSRVVKARGVSANLSSAERGLATFVQPRNAGPVP